MLKIFICLQFLFGFWTGTRSDEICDRKRFQVLVFTGTDCPISQDYVGVINQLMVDYPDVSFSGIVPAPASAEEVETFRKEYQVNFALGADGDPAMTTRYQVHITPEVVLLDDRGEVQYQGAIDNWYYALGKHRQLPTRHYLKDAMDALRQGTTIEIKRTEAVGCIINKPAHKH